MSHKTKKEKIIADLRRKISQQKNTVNLQNETPKENNTSKNQISYKPVFNLNTKYNDLQNQNLVLPDYSYIISDLKKTLFLTFVILMLEMLLFWTFELNGIKIFK